MRKVTHDYTQPATTDSACNLVDALTLEIARLGGPVAVDLDLVQPGVALRRPVGPTGRAEGG